MYISESFLEFLEGKAGIVKKAVRKVKKVVKALAAQPRLDGIVSKQLKTTRGPAGYNVHSTSTASINRLKQMSKKILKNQRKVAAGVVGVAGVGTGAAIVARKNNKSKK